MALKYLLETSLDTHTCEIRAHPTKLLDLKATVGNGYVGATCGTTCSHVKIDNFSFSDKFTSHRPNFPKLTSMLDHVHKQPHLKYGFIPKAHSEIQQVLLRNPYRCSKNVTIKGVSCLIWLYNFIVN